MRSLRTDYSPAILEFLGAFLVSLAVRYWAKDSIAANVIWAVGSLISLSILMISSHFASRVEKVSKAYGLMQRIREMCDEEYRERAERCEREFLNEIEELARGTIRYMSSADVYAAFQREIVKARRITQHTTFIDHSASQEWKVREGLKNYFELHREAIRRGLKSTRIFALDENEEDNEYVGKILKEQLEAGVDVYTVKRNDIPSVLAVDLAIFDRAVVIVSHLDKGDKGQVISGWKSIDPVEVTRVKRTYEQLLGHYAKKFTR